MPNKKTTLLSMTFTIIVMCLLYGIYSFSTSKITVNLDRFVSGFTHPADIIEFNGKVYITELLNSRVAISDFNLSKPTDFLIHPNKKQRFGSPHHLSQDGENLYISAGWGRSIYQFSSDLKTFAELPSDRSLLHAPHGICRQGNWLYIADSLNSRLLRININAPDQYEIFADHAKRVAYGRQLICTQDEIWLSNSYEKREGLNTGTGANVLRINNFESGNSDIITTFPNSNITGIYLHKNRYLFTALWHQNNISVFDIKKKKILDTTVTLPQERVGPAYGMYYSETNHKLYIAFIGDIYNKQYKGGIGVYSLNK